MVNSDDTGGPGFEPEPAEPESAVLPTKLSPNDDAFYHNDFIGSYYSICQLHTVFDQLFCFFLVFQWFQIGEDLLFVR